MTDTPLVVDALNFLTQYFMPGFVGHVEVEQNQLEGLSLNFVQTGLAVFSFIELVAVVGKYVLE